MADTETCRFVRFLLPKYQEGKCTETERILIKDHCAHCQDCSNLLQMVGNTASGKDVKELLFLSPLRLSEIYHINVENKKDPEATAKSTSSSHKTESTIHERGSLKMPLKVSWLFGVFAAVMIILSFADSRTSLQPSKKPASEISDNKDSSTVSEDIASSVAESSETTSETVLQKVQQKIVGSEDEEEGDYPIEWNDDALEAAIRKITGIEKRDIMYSDVYPLEALYLSGSEISNITALSCLTNLKVLDLSENHISDISSLSGLTNLASLDLSWNQISDINALHSLVNLKNLALNNNQISKIITLRHLTNLTSLNLEQNHISSINALRSMANLTSLNLQGNQISDYSPIESLNINTLYK